MKRMISIVITALLVTSCNAVTTLQLNDDLTDLEKELIDARKMNDTDRENAAGEDLRSLAAQAERNAGKAKTTADAISLYRIAATAAWQGESANVVVLSANGFEKCEELGPENAPRDCFMLLTIPDLAATDELTTRLGLATQRVGAERAKAPDEQSQEVLSEIGTESDDIFGGLRGRFTGLSSAMTQFSDIAPAELLVKTKENQDFIFCRLSDALGVQIRSVGDTDPDFVENRAALESIRQDHDPGDQVNCASI